MAGRSAAYFFISRIFYVAAAIADLRPKDARDVMKGLLDAPETAGGESGGFEISIHIFSITIF